MRGPESEEVKILESMGYVITTDQEDKTLIKILGHYVNDEGEHCYCRQKRHYG
jgi:hypothetical protein